MNMKRTLQCLALASAVGIAIPLPASVSKLCGEFPVWSTGDLEFSVDLLSFQGVGQQTLAQISCSLTNDQIRFVEAETGEARGTLRMETEFEDMDGRTVDAAERRIDVRALSMLQGDNRDVIQVLQLERQLD